jgi:hypothetical protein
MAVIDSTHRGATAVRFHTRPMSDGEANALHEELGDLVPVHDVRLAGADGAPWVGAVAPIDASEAALLELIDRLRGDARIEGLTVAVGSFP